jgi:lysophospholipase L1-like esterase
MKDRLTHGAGLGAIFVMCVALVACGGSPTGPSTNPPPTQPPPTDNPAPPPPPPPPPPTLGITRILAFGDSMTEGTTSTPVTNGLFALDAGLSRSYPFKLQALTTQRYSAQTIQVLNAGHAGNQAVNDMGRFSAVIGDAKPQLVLLLEGANDLNQPFAEGEGFNARVTKTVSALEEMVKDAGFRGIPVMIGTLPPQRAGAPKATNPDLLDRFNRAVKTMAANKGAQLIDVNAMIPLSEIGQDGLHPTEAGYQHLAEIWLDAIKAKYEKAATP